MREEDNSCLAIRHQISLHPNWTTQKSPVASVGRTIHSTNCRGHYQINKLNTWTQKEYSFPSIHSWIMLLCRTRWLLVSSESANENGLKGTIKVNRTACRLQIFLLNVNSHKRMNTHIYLWNVFRLFPLRKTCEIFCRFLQLYLDFSQSPIFSWDRLNIPRLTVTAILIFKCTKGAGVGRRASGEKNIFLASSQTARAP